MSERTKGKNPGDEYQDGHRLRQYPVTTSGPFISHYKTLCDACAERETPNGPQYAGKHWARSTDNCESLNHDFNAVVGGIKEPSEFEHYKDHPDVWGWAKDNFTGRGSDTTLCPSCAKDRNSSGHDMEDYYAIADQQAQPGDSCDDCGHWLATGRKEASMRRKAISDAEMRRLTDLPPLDLPFNQAGSCDNCGARLGPGETGLCPACEQAGGGRKTRHKQRQKLVQQKRGGVMEHTGMLRVLAAIWDEATPKGGSFEHHEPGEDCPDRGKHSWMAPDECPGHYNSNTQGPGHITRGHGLARDKYQGYRGNKAYVPIANKTFLWKDEAGNHHIRHHETDIMSFSPKNQMTVNTGGWMSQTTMSRLNDHMPEGYRVSTHRRKWTMHTPEGDHPFEDGMSFNLNTGKKMRDADKVRPTGDPVMPPKARGTDTSPPRLPPPDPNWRQVQEGPTGVPLGRTTQEERWQQIDQRLRGERPRAWNDRPPGDLPGNAPMHEQIRHELQQTDYEQRGNPGADTESFGNDYYEPVHVHEDDMPKEGESYDDWLDRTTTAPKNVACPSCKGKGTVRSKGPVPPGVNPWEHKETCTNCGGEGLVRNARLTRHGGLASLETLSRRYTWGLRVLAYGEVKAPVNVDTLREDACPVCGENDAFDGDQCQVCGFVTPPKMFRDPDLDAAKLLDLRQDPASGDPNDQNPNVGANLPPVDESEVDEDGDVAPGAEGEEAGEPTDEAGEDGIVEGEARGLGDVGEPVDEAEVDEEGEPAEGAEAAEQEEGEPVDEDEVDDDGDVVGGPEDPEAAQKHLNQGGEPFTKGPNAPDPESPAEPGEQVDGLEEESEDEASGGAPGTPGDSVPDLFCPACGFEAGAASPTSTPGNAMAPADAGDGMLEGDICPECQKATLMGPAEMEQAEQMQPGAMAR